jgi:FtsH-binding integral membrane protein
MSEYNSQSQVYYESGESLRTYITKVFTTMTIGLLITTLVAFDGYLSLMRGGIFLQVLSSAPWIVYVLLFAELGVAIAMSMGITKFSPMTCRILFFVYSALTGLTFSTLPLAYGVTTVFTAFLFAAVLFACCAVIGHTTNVDLTQFRGLLMGALLALVLVSVISLFVPVLRESMWIGYLGLAVFLGLTAFDMQKIKQFYYGTGEGTIRESLAVYAAFQLYLDFINMFLYILRILGSRSSRK